MAEPKYNQTISFDIRRSSISKALLPFPLVLIDDGLGMAEKTFNGMPLTQQGDIVPNA